MRFVACILLIGILFSSCSKKEKSQDLLPAKKMKEVMWDLLRADQYVAGSALKDSPTKKKNESIKLYEEIFHLHHITRNQFKKSYDYYSSRPDLFQPILDSLAVRKVDVSPPATNTHRIPDSVKPIIKRTIKKQ